MNSLRILAAPSKENDVLDEDRQRLAAWAPLNGWEYFEYADAFDLIARISDVQASAAQEVAELEIVAHGNPATCNDISIENAAIAGESLRRVSGVSDRTVVYLSGCNTGLEFNGECVGRSFAAALRSAVFGARGYITGTHAEGTERCAAAFELHGIVYHSYPGGIDAAGDDAWNRFGTPSRPSGGGKMQVKVATSGFRSVSIADPEGRDLVSAIEAAIRMPSAESARMRMAPDLTFALQLSDGEHVFELLAGGTVLRDPVTKRVWQFERGREVLKSLLPYRKLPAA